ncbi:MAG: pyridoxal-phosphate dependent enzyme, partial [Planctomycetes bacterium]|nr:pyridoxal-phosphate dependent enzyme [Planctomycetota bacterium]
EARQELVERIVAESGAIELHPHSSTNTLASDTTVGYEILAQLEVVPGAILVPASGGGLLAGCALAMQLEGKETRVVGVQPSGSPAFVRSFAAGHRVTVASVDTLADGLQASCPGALGFEVAQHYVSAMIEIDEADIAPAVRWFAVEEKLVVEPSGAVPLAALLAGQGRDLPEPIVVVASGGNLHPDLLADLIG